MKYFMRFQGIIIFPLIPFVMFATWIAVDKKGTFTDHLDCALSTWVEMFWRQEK